MELEAPAGAEGVVGADEAVIVELEAEEPEVPEILR
jgi:hypothetical protein